MTKVRGIRLALTLLAVPAGCQTQTTNVNVIAGGPAVPRLPSPTPPERGPHSDRDDTSGNPDPSFTSAALSRPLPDSDDIGALQLEVAGSDGAKMAIAVYVDGKEVCRARGQLSANYHRHYPFRDALLSGRLITVACGNIDAPSEGTHRVSVSGSVFLRDNTVMNVSKTEPMDFRILTSLIIVVEDDGRVHIEGIYG